MDFSDSTLLGRLDDVGASITPFGAPAGDDRTDQAVGIAAGTHVQTRRGEVAAEALLPGEEVLTASGGFARVRSVVTSHRDGAASRPGAPKIRIRRDALGVACPFEDVLLAPAQRICIGAVTIPAASAIDGRMILREQIEDDRLVRIELDAPSLLLAGGLAVASA